MRQTLTHVTGGGLQASKPKTESSAATTMDLYVHAYDEDLREAVGTLDRALGS